MTRDNVFSLTYVKQVIGSQKIEGRSRILKGLADWPLELKM